MRLYNQKIIDCYQNTKCCGCFADDEEHVISARSGRADVGTVICLQLKLSADNKTIIDAKFKVHGSAYALAVCALFCERIINTPYAELENFDLESLISELEIPEQRKHCVWQVADLLTQLA